MLTADEKALLRKPEFVQNDYVVLASVDGEEKRFKALFSDHWLDGMVVVEEEEFDNPDANPSILFFDEIARLES